MASAARSRRPRPKESQFVSTTLADKWDATAVLKDPGFAWDGTGYGSSRNQAIDETSMLPYAKALQTLLEVAPSGFPAQKSLKDTFEEMDKRHGILCCDARFVQRAASLASDAWRVMTKHLYNAAQAEKALANKELQQLVKMIRLPSAEDDGGAALGSGGSFDGSPSAAVAAGPEEGDCADMSAQAVRALFPRMAEGDPEAEKTDVEFSDSDVELCGMKCNCQACREARTVDLTGGEGSPVPIPNAELGGQKRETKAAQAAQKGGKGKSKGKPKGKGKGKGKSKSQNKDKPKGKGKGKGKHKTKSQAEEGKDKPKKRGPTTPYTVRMRLLGKMRWEEAVALKPPKKAETPPKQEQKAEDDGGDTPCPQRSPRGSRLRRGVARPTCSTATRSTSWASPAGGPRSTKISSSAPRRRSTASS